MCTLSIIPQDSGVLITMNRDEQRNRPEQETLFTASDRCFPVDERSQGTWVGCNDHGIALALLNRYQDEQRDQPERSRGDLIPELLSCADLNTVEKTLRSFEIHHFNPFECLAMTQDTMVQATWNGQILYISCRALDAPFFITSSSERLDDVTQYRQSIWAKFLKQNTIGAQNVLRDLHLSRGQGDDTSSILMRRAHTHTKSITQITLTPQSAKMSYWPQSALNANDIQDSAISHALRLGANAAPCKASSA